MSTESTFKAPPELYDVDGVVIAARGHGHSRLEMLEFVAEHADWVIHDLGYWTDDDRWVFRLSEVRALTEDFKEVWFRPADMSIEWERDGEFGADGWWPCDAGHRLAVPYTLSGLGS